MPPEVPLETWQADIPWGHADYERPVIFLGHRAHDKLAVLRVSSNLDLMDPDRDFLIQETHENFAATGLDSSSYAEAQMMILSPEKFTKAMGAIVGKMRRDFEEWIESGVLR